jgi:hypothetical protein
MFGGIGIGVSIPQNELQITILDDNYLRPFVKFGLLKTLGIIMFIIPD